MAAVRGNSRRLVLVASILGSSMASVDAGVVNVALPRIGQDLGLGLAGRQWIYLSYSLALASLYLCDRIRRRVARGGCRTHGCGTHRRPHTAGCRRGIPDY
jgi:MFS family permease